ncbi:MAG: hypothetical protein ACREMH_03515 [Gemmatimonadales bacterium]
MRHPADGVIDALMLAMGPRPVGFDLQSGPFGALRVKDAVYRHGHGKFELRHLCDGWIYTKPLGEFQGVTPIPGWVHAGNLDRAHEQCANPAFRSASAEEFNSAIAGETDISARWGHLQ